MSALEDTSADFATGLAAGLSAASSTAFGVDLDLDRAGRSAFAGEASPPAGESAAPPATLGLRVAFFFPTALRRGFAPGLGGSRAPKGTVSELESEVLLLEVTLGVRSRRHPRGGIPSDR
ncbi:hypothetical protein Pla86_21040 [Planctomycetes bacterium Pla86]|uniref:Uncharacterized protein n=1 Tax=Engelhardtia mirabilis TaxID=2528011 RepID=A0A518BJ74_9BACT|nr:hypothetical protein Pla133_21040 [Planctomycetes bacterium Pla133]QDV01353.1 hypothetical protein Pla86_21040 [Planctomycetes bacterium Pla86]